MFIDNTNQEFEISLEMPRLSIDGTVHINFEEKNDIDKGHNQGSIHYKLIFSKDGKFICEIPFKLVFDEYTPEADIYPGVIKTLPSIVSKIECEDYSLNPSYEDYATNINNFIQRYKESGQKVIKGNTITGQQIEELIGYD